MEPTIYKPSIYKGAGIYKTGAGGGGGGGSSYGIEINGHYYGLAKFNIYGQEYLITTSDLIEPAGNTGQGVGFDDYIKKGGRFYYHNRGNVQDLLNAIAPDGFAVPTEELINMFLNYIGDICSQYSFGGGLAVNRLGVSLFENGYIDYSGNIKESNNCFIGYLGSNQINVDYLGVSGGSLQKLFSQKNGDFYYPTRLVKAI